MKKNEKNLFFNNLKIENNSKQIYTDIRDFNSLKKQIKRLKPEIIFHLAAQSLVTQSFIDPIETYSTNIMGVANLLEICRHEDSIKSIIIVTSDKCYENIEKNIYYKESNPMGGFDPYSSSKGCAEIITSAYYRSFFCNNKNNSALSSVRAGNVIGGGDWADDRIIPDFIKAMKSNQPIKLRYPESIRPWQHVLEPLYGYMKLAEKQYLDKQNFSGAWNFGPKKNNIVSVKELVTSLNKYIDEKVKIKFSRMKNYHEAKILKLDSTKANKYLKWEPLLTFNESIRLTIDWYISFLQNNKNIEIITTNQINNFEKKISK